MEDKDKKDPRKSFLPVQAARDMWYKIRRSDKRQFIRKHGASIYMAIAFCMIAAIAVSVLALNLDYAGNVSELELSEINIPNITVPRITSAPTTPNPTEAPVAVTPSGVDSVIKETNGTPTNPVFTRPVSGKTILGFALDTVVFSNTMNDYRCHTGIDMAADIGSAVCAYTDGTITKIESTPMMGYAITIQHDYGLTSHYMNISENIPKGIAEGVQVKSGDIIAAVGSTAIAEISDAPHLHFELKVNGEYINPQDEMTENK